VLVLSFRLWRVALVGGGGSGSGRKGSSGSPDSPGCRPGVVTVVDVQSVVDPQVTAVQLSRIG